MWLDFYGLLCNERRISVVKPQWQTSHSSHPALRSVLCCRSLLSRRRQITGIGALRAHVGGCLSHAVSCLVTWSSLARHQPGAQCTKRFNGAESRPPTFNHPL